MDGFWFIHPLRAASHVAPSHVAPLTPFHAAPFPYTFLTIHSACFSVLAEVIQAPWMEEMHPEKQVMIAEVFKGVFARNRFDMDVWLSAWQVGISSSCTQVTIFPGDFPRFVPPTAASLAPFGNAQPSAPPCACADLAVPTGTGTWHNSFQCVTCFHTLKILKFSHLPVKD